MKKVILTIALAAIAATSAFAQIDFGVGYTNNTLKETMGSVSENVSGNGFYVGADYTITELGPVKVTPGAYLNWASFKDDADINMFTLDIPVNFSFGFDLTSAIRGFVYAGPTFELGLSATQKLGDEADYNLYEDMMKRFDIKLGGGIGVDINSLVRVTFGYNAGMLNLSQDDDWKLKNNGLHFGVAYLF